MSSYLPPDPAALAWVGRVVGGEVRGHRRLRGGITAAVDRVALESRGGLREVVLKRWVDGDEPADVLVARESAALRAVAGLAVPAPELIASDETGHEAGVPCLVMSFVPGEPVLTAADLTARLPALASTQAAIHALPAELTAVAAGWFDPSRDRDWIADVGLRRDALAAAAPADRQPVLAHGDYQPFNVLWRDESIVGVVDWTVAGVGPRGVDVGHCRLNLAVLIGPDAADDYLRAYERAAGVSVDPGSELRAMLSWSRDWQRFIPLQLAGRADTDIGSMAERVVEAVRRTLDRVV